MVPGPWSAGSDRHSATRSAPRVWIAAFILAIALAGLPPTSLAQTAIPVEALAAEGREDWSEALRLYRALLDRDPARVDVWVRVSDIHARLRQFDQAAAALAGALQARRDDPVLYARLSQAYAAADRAQAALAAMQAALVLAPREPSYLRAAGELAAWCAEYGIARQSYEALAALEPGDATVLLALARVSAWDGATDRSARAYRDYLTLQPDDRDAWLEAARAESWRGNNAGAVALLDDYLVRFGESDRYRRERAGILTRARRPGEALALLRPLLAAGERDFEVTALHTLALMERGEEADAKRTLASIAPEERERAEADSLRRQMRNAFGSTVLPSGTAYGDSDGLRSYRTPLSVGLAVTPGVRLQAGYERHELRARTGSGLDRADGGGDAALDRAWAGAELRPWRSLAVRVQGGRHDSASRREPAWSAGVTLRAGDTLRLDYDREHALLAISPRTVSLGIVRDADRVRVAWTPSLRAAVDLDVSREALSDDNLRRGVRAAPRFAVVRTQYLNLDVGASVSLFTADRNLDHGYYDPDLYHSYSLTVMPYFKLSENTGLSLFLEAGAQRDDTMRSFEPGGTGAAELTVGIYRAWMLTFSASATSNARLDSGAFRGVSAGLGLSRKF